MESRGTRDGESCVTNHEDGARCVAALDVHATCRVNVCCDFKRKAMLVEAAANDARGLLSAGGSVTWQPHRQTKTRRLAQRETPCL